MTLPDTNIKRAVGFVILAPFMLPLGIFTLLAVVPLSIIGFPVWLGIVLVQREPLSTLVYFYRELFTGFAVFPFKIWFGVQL